MGSLFLWKVIVIGEERTLREKKYTMMAWEAGWMHDFVLTSLAVMYASG